MSENIKIRLGPSFQHNHMQEMFNRNFITKTNIWYIKVHHCFTLVWTDIIYFTEEYDRNAFWNTNTLKNLGTIIGTPSYHSYIRVRVISVRVILWERNLKKLLFFYVKTETLCRTHLLINYMLHFSSSRTLYHLWLHSTDMILRTVLMYAIKHLLPIL